MSIAFADPSAQLYAHSSNAEGDMVDSIRSECGFILQGIDWAARKLGYDLIGAIMDPISGDFSAVDGMRQDWHALSAGLASLGDNYQAMADNLSGSWSGRAADKAHRRLTRMARGHGKQAEAAELMSMQMNNMLTAVKEACKLVANVLGLIEELLLSFSIAKWAKEVLTMGSGVRRAITLIDKAITFIKNLNNVIPPILKAAGLMAAMFRTLNMTFMLPMSFNEHRDSAQHIDDTANSGFGDPGS